ncbi:MAG: mRNA interferase RelE/StbE [Actinomycetota bacterium]|nr:mRNA interferase RelE/StbE [Actinomycetota bacterium]
MVWRVEQDEVGDYLIDVAELSAVGYRKDSEVYAEISQRITHAGPAPKANALSEVLEILAKQSRDLTVTPETATPEPVPKWLTEALLYVVRIPSSRVERMSLDEAEKSWTDHISGTGRGV